MLEPDMDIESDLGVDSIKKVEIISELEKHLPDTQGLTPENIGTARTLNDICHAIAAKSQEMPTYQRPTPALHPDSDKPAPARPANGGDEPDSGISDAMTVLMDIINELTGFPKEMLEPGMDLESDLGVDSIKRVEILSRLEQEMGDRALGLSGDDMVGLKTIQDMVRFLEQTDATSPKADVKKNASLRDDASDIPETPALIRQTLFLEKTPLQQVRYFNGSRIQLPDSGKIYITQDQAQVSHSLKQAFEGQGYEAILLDPSSDPLPDLPDVAGLVMIQDQVSSPDSGRATAFLKTAFALAHENGKHLQAAGARKGAFLATLTFSGGGFGVPPCRFDTLPEYGGLAGLAKTAAKEWKEVLCHALDLPGNMDVCHQYAEAVASLMMTRGPVEMGLNKDFCQVPMLKPAPVDPGRPVLADGDVAVITGGARGVTADCAVELAGTRKLTIVLMGRSPAPSDEPEWAAALSDPAALKKAILTREFAGKKPTPAVLEKRYQAIQAGREIQHTLARIRSHGSKGVYLSTDIRDPEAVKTAFNHVRKHFNGPVSCVVHGAGVLEDKWIVDKHPDQFDRVFDTKVDGLNALLDATRDDPLKYLIVFSSIAARTGNQGQCDYAMANEVLNKRIARISETRPDCKCLAVNWGPWNGGMVHDGLKQMFTQKGVGLIPVDAGARHLIQEMADPNREHTEVVITAASGDQKKKNPPRLSSVAKIEISPQTLPILAAHQINHEPVMPIALMAEIMAQTAEKTIPAWYLPGWMTSGC